MFKCLFFYHFFKKSINIIWFLLIFCGQSAYITFLPTSTGRLWHGIINEKIGLNRLQKKKNVFGRLHLYLERCLHFSVRQLGRSEQTLIYYISKNSETVLRQSTHKTSYSNWSCCKFYNKFYSFNVTIFNFLLYDLLSYVICFI